MKNIIIEIFDN